MIIQIILTFILGWLKIEIMAPAARAALALSIKRGLDFNDVPKKINLWSLITGKHDDIN